MKKLVSLCVILVLIVSLSVAAFAAAPDELGWHTDNDDFTGWTVEGGTITGSYADTANDHRIWNPCIQDRNNLSVEFDLSSDNTTSPYIMILNIRIELDGNNGNGDQVFVKVNDQNKDWLNANGTKVHVKLTRENGGDLNIVLTGSGNDTKAEFTVEAAALGDSENIEIGMYRGGGIVLSNWSVVSGTEPGGETGEPSEPSETGEPSGTVEPSETGGETGSGEPPRTGDIFGVVVAMMAVSAVALVALKKK